MRFAHLLAGMLLLIVGIPALFAGGALWIVARHADPGGSFSARLETVRTPGHAVVVTDLADLLRREAPFTLAGQNHLRLAARTAEGPAFLGLAPTDKVRRYLDPVPHAAVGRVALARGPLPVRLDQVGPAVPGPSATPVSAPIDQPFWVREGIGALEWSPAELGDGSLSLVIMRPDGRADLALELRGELRVGWLDPATWGLLASGALLVALAVVILLRPVRPREVVFVVEPDQVPVLASRLGVTSLGALGAERAPVGSGDGRVLVAERSLAAVASIPAERARPATLADLPPLVDDPEGAARANPVTGWGRRPEAALTLAWPPLAPDGTVLPVMADGSARSVDGAGNPVSEREARAALRRNAALPTGQGVDQA